MTSASDIEKQQAWLEGRDISDSSERGEFLEATADEFEQLFNDTDKLKYLDKARSLHDLAKQTEPDPDEKLCVFLNGFAKDIHSVLRLLWRMETGKKDDALLKILYLCGGKLDRDMQIALTRAKASSHPPGVLPTLLTDLLFATAIDGGEFYKAAFWAGAATYVKESSTPKYTAPPARFYQPFANKNKFFDALAKHSYNAKTKKLYEKRYQDGVKLRQMMSYPFGQNK